MESDHCIPSLSFTIFFTDFCVCHTLHMCMGTVAGLVTTYYDQEELMVKHYNIEGW